MIGISLTHVARAVGAFMPRDVSVTVRRVVSDSRDVKAGDLFFAIRGERFDGHDFVAEALERGAAGCVVEQEGMLDDRVVTVDSTIDALGKLATHYRAEVMSVGTRVVAVTGSNGKTTTKCMLDHVLGDSLKGKASPRSFNNEIGLPISLLAADAGDDYMIVEIGTNAPGEIATLSWIASPDIAVITSLGEAHLEKLGDLPGVAREKAAILSTVRPDGLAFVNADCPEIYAHLDQFTGRRLTMFGFSDGATLRVNEAVDADSDSSFLIGDDTRLSVPMPGRHHAANAAVVFGVAREFGLPPEHILHRLASFRAARGRSQRIEHRGVCVVDDSYNANPASMSAAINALHHTPGKRRLMVMGDMLELGDRSTALHRTVIETALSASIDRIFVIGDAMCSAADRIADEGNGRLVRAPGWEAAGEAILAETEPGDVVWIKGSRKMALDRLVDRLCDRLSADIETST